MNSPAPLRVFAGTGIELEYMLVDRNTLNVAPCTDEVLKQVAGSYVGDVERGPLAWSNELALHVIELKTNGPATSLQPLAGLFHQNIQTINAILDPMNACLMPGGMHPWMEPDREMRLWPHDYNAVYAAFDRIFNCRGHGWANLQSMHINLPFADDNEFARLHAAIRLVLPLLPALAASSPLCEGQLTGQMDTRLDVYRSNCARIPAITGHVIPETVTSRDDYQAKILAPMYRAVAPHDPDGILQEEWLNARGAIARFDRSAIEIRVLDTQECPAADIAMAALIIALLQALYANQWSTYETQQLMSVQDLERIFLAVVREGDLAIIDDRQFLDVFQFPEQRCEARELWQCLYERLPLADDQRPAIDTVLQHGPLARRIVRAAGSAPSKAQLTTIYRELCACLADNRQFLPDQSHA